MSDPNQPGSPNSKGDGPTAMFRLKLDGWMDELIKKDFEEPSPDAEAPPADPAAAAPSQEAPPEEPPPAPRKPAPPGFAAAPGFATKPGQPPKR